MTDRELQRRFLPMSETSYYILLSLTTDTHGYAIMQEVDALTGGRVRLGAGTLYGTLGKMTKERLIEVVAEEDRRKLYRLTPRGRSVLRLEIARLEELLRNAARLGEVTDA